MMSRQLCSQSLSPVVDPEALADFRSSGVTGVLAGLGVVNLRQLRQGPMQLHRRGWRLLAENSVAWSRRRHYAVGRPPELGQVLTVDLEARTVTLDTYAGARIHSISAGLDSSRWQSPRQSS